MSRLMNFGEADAAANSYSGVSRSTTRVTVSSNDHIESWLDTDETLIDT